MGDPPKSGSSIDKGVFMNIKQAKEEIIRTVRAYTAKDCCGCYKIPSSRQRPILLIGPPGIGKTAVMEQAARTCGVGFVAYTITHHTRQSAIGLPRLLTHTFAGCEYTVTEYTMSEIVASIYRCMEESGLQEGILFIDEINCASETLAPVMLQFLQNKQFGSHRIPRGWIITAAGNPEEYNKSVREFDIATLDRVRRINIDVDFSIWKEYALENQIHGAILSYLEAKPQNFYHIHASHTQQSFVTARGWEDLSDLLLEYEELEIPIEAPLIGQYLQDEEISGDFYDWYQLYMKYDQSYRTAAILNGALDSEALDRQKMLLTNAPFTERLAVISLFVSGMNARFTAFSEKRAKLALLHETIAAFRSFQKRQPNLSAEEQLSQFLTQEKKRLAVKLENGLITEHDETRARHALADLGHFSYLCAEQHALDAETGFTVIRNAYQNEIQKLEEGAADVKKALENVCAYFDGSIGLCTETGIFAAALLQNGENVRFLAEHPCENFLKYQEMLLLEKRQQELIEKIEKFR